MPAKANATPPAEAEFLLANRWASDQYCPLHVHPGVELVWVTEGRCAISLDGRRLEGTRGTLFILPAHVPHDQETTGFSRTTYVVLQVSPRRFDDSARTLHLPKETWMRRWMEDLCDLHALPDRPPALITRGILMALVGRIKQIENRRTGDSELHPALVRALALIETHFTESLDVRTIASHAHCSPSHLTALFRRRPTYAPRAPA